MFKAIGQNQQMNTLSIDVTAAKSGDVKAFERVINACKNTVTSIALSVVKDVDASEEVAQQVFIKCWNNLGTLNNDQSFLPWIRQSTRYTAINYLRDNKVGQRASSEEADSVFELFCSDDSALEDNVEQLQLQKIVSTVLDKLPDESREVVLLYYREQQSSPQVAKLLGISESAVRKRLSRSRESLKTSVLEKFGQVLYSTAPAISFTSITLASLLSSKPALASVGTISMSSGGTWFTKIISKLFSVAMLGPLLGMFSAFWSHKVAEKQVTDLYKKAQLKRYRNYMMLWIFIFGCGFLVSIEITSSAWAPLMVYLTFVAGLMHIMKRSQSIISISMLENIQSDKDKKDYEFQKFWGVVGLYGGALIGLVGLIVGLIGSGRLMF